MFGDADLELLQALNSLVGSNKLLWSFGNNTLIRGFPIFFPLIALWFSSDCIKRRSRMLAGLSATCFAVVLPVWLQHHITPPHSPALGSNATFEYCRFRMELAFQASGIVSQRHGYTVFFPGCYHLLRKSADRMFLLSLGVGDYFNHSRRLWMALSKRYRWRLDPGTGMRLFVYQNSIRRAANRTRDEVI
jgi:hypothetical protein